MSESEIKEAAESKRMIDLQMEWADKLSKLGVHVTRGERNSFQAGFMLCIEHADKEAYNRATDDIITILDNWRIYRPHLDKDLDDIIHGIKKVRK